MNSVNAINIRALKFFIAVYDSKSFSVVARREGVSPSMVSRVIQQLEDALGQQLFYRNTRAIIPTEAARLFIEFARETSEQLLDVRNKLQDRKEEPEGVVRINAPVFFGQRHLAPWLPGLFLRHPKLRVELTLTDDYIDPHLEPADVIFRIDTLNDSSLHARVLGNQVYHLAASPEYVKMHGQPEAPEDLTQHNCLVYSGSSGPNRWLFKAPNGAWEQQMVDPILASNNAETLLTSALNGTGIVLFPDWLIGDYLKNGSLVKLLKDLPTAIKTTPQYIAAIYPDSRHQPLNVRAVIDYFVTVFGSPPYWQYSE
ncbi:LysR family transcriptional regulator [Aliidiomarina sedimenti]|uniref:LysR family transcriptional regulator n=1 Tax=Aliidiomarina sedimenti TaxID=1933879 RepID=A0ABY0C0C7_9GAMM|nr:LysR family transcriptional regulator [Aliidiomarina sedimenti]RUO30799.1 LysR family transcriptional regulator [Aliidiomarina sedimenti]